MSDEILERLKAAAPRVERIDVEYGPFFMQAISGEMNWHLMQIQEDLQKGGRKSIPPPVIISVALCNEDGSPLCEELADTMRLVARMERRKMYELYDHALRVTGLGVAIKAVEDGEKKSSSSPNSENGTNLPS
jgi:hypothetical protein